jgi:uncharacterized protein with FMN-binding domain
MFPRRGGIAAFVTAIALVALLAYKTPDLQAPDDPAAIVDAQSSGPSAVAIGGDASASLGPLGSDGYWPSASDDQTTTTTPGQSPTAGNPNPGAAPTPHNSTPPGQTPTPGRPPTPAPPGPPAKTPTPPPKAGFTGTVTGAVSSMKYGPVQVRAVFSNGRMTDVVAVQTPTGDSHSVSIAQHAVPILRSEALSAQSANIHTVSGATYTSKAYIASLQSAISKAK